MSLDRYLASTASTASTVDTSGTMSRAATYSSTGRFTREELGKIHLFETYYQQLVQDKSAQLREENVAIESQVNSQDVNLQNNSGKYFYFVGRANPPHDGHIEGLLSLCLHAIENGGTAIILLGSGPNNGARTPKDPLDFDLKSSFIKDKLKDRLNDKGYSHEQIDAWFTDGTIQIQEMGKPVDQIRNVMREDLNKKVLSELEAIRLSGAKDGGEDLNKLKWMEKALAAGIFDSEGNLIPIRATVIPVPAVQIEGESTPMSATIIRNIIYEMDPSISDPEDITLYFKKKTNRFYVTSRYDYTPEIAAEIYRYKPARTYEKMEVPLAKAPTKAVAKAKAPKKAAATVVAVPALKKRGTEEGPEEGPTKGPTKGSKEAKKTKKPATNLGGSRRKTRRHRTRRRTKRRKTKRRRSRRRNYNIL